MEGSWLELPDLKIIPIHPFTHVLHGFVSLKDTCGNKKKSEKTYWRPVLQNRGQVPELTGLLEMWCLKRTFNEKERLRAGRIISMGLFL